MCQTIFYFFYLNVWVMLSSLAGEDPFCSGWQSMQGWIGGCRVRGPNWAINTKSYNVQRTSLKRGQRECKSQRTGRSTANVWPDMAVAFTNWNRSWAPTQDLHTSMRSGQSVGSLWIGHCHMRLHLWLREYWWLMAPESGTAILLAIWLHSTNCTLVG